MAKKEYEVMVEIVSTTRQSTTIRIKAKNRSFARAEAERLIETDPSAYKWDSQSEGVKVIKSRIVD